MSDKFNDRIFALEASNANASEWAALARDILASKHRAEGGSDFISEVFESRLKRIHELETALDAAQLTIEALEDELGDAGTNPGEHSNTAANHNHAVEQWHKAEAKLAEVREFASGYDKTLWGKDVLYILEGDK